MSAGWARAGVVRRVRRAKREATRRMRRLRVENESLTRREDGA
jgi:hypothetical protein